MISLHFFLFFLFVCTNRVFHQILSFAINQSFSKSFSKEKKKKFFSQKLFSPFLCYNFFNYLPTWQNPDNLRFLFQTFFLSFSPLLSLQPLYPTSFKRISFIKTLSLPSLLSPSPSPFFLLAYGRENCETSLIAFLMSFCLQL